MKIKINYYKIVSIPNNYLRISTQSNPSDNFISNGNTHIHLYLVRDAVCILVDSLLVISEHKHVINILLHLLLLYNVQTPDMPLFFRSGRYEFS